MTALKTAIVLPLIIEALPQNCEGWLRLCRTVILCEACPWSTMKPHILICNDDGIYAPGIMVLYEAVRDIGEVTVVAPDAEQSAVGHAITLSPRKP